MMKHNLFILLILSCLMVGSFVQTVAGQDIKRGYSMPEAWPTYTTPPYLYRDNEIISIMFKTSPEALKSLVPEPLAPNPMGLAVVYIGRLNLVEPIALSYLEAGIVIPSLFNGKMGSYVLIMYLDKALPIIAGREIFGYAKKDAVISFSHENGKITGNVVRDGIELITLSIEQMEHLEQIPPQPKIPWYSLKVFPSILQNAPPDVKQIVSIPSGSDTKRLHSGKGTLAFQSSRFDPLGDIPILEIIKSEFAATDLVLDYGEVLFDYLKEN